MLVKFTNLSILEKISLPTEMTDPHQSFGLTEPMDLSSVHCDILIHLYIYIRL